VVALAWVAAATSFAATERGQAARLPDGTQFTFWEPPLPDRMVSYEAAPGALVLVKASEVLRDGWQPSKEPMRGSEGGPVRIWKHELSGALPRRLQSLRHGQWAR
jgi:hypothetical protein